MANYSSLFTLGLLSDRASPPPSPKSNFFYQFRKSSLPTRTLSNRPSDESASPSDSLRSLPQFTNPFASSPEATTEPRSFLSLDLAADKCWTRRRSDKPLSSLNTNVVLSSPSLSLNLPPGQRVPSPSSHLPLPMSPTSLPPARRSSRDSLRTLPSPRPAPSSALPEVPCDRKEPHPLPPIFIPSPSQFPSTRSPGGPSPTSLHAPLSAPPATSLSSPGTSSSFVQTPPAVSPLSSPSYRSTRLGSFMSFSSTSPSLRTARRRNMERSNALACLEGRSRTPGRVPRKARGRNFMSMSDDEDEEAAGDDEDAGRDADVEDDSDAPERSPRANTSRLSSVSSASARRSPGRKNHSAGSGAEYRSPVDEEEDRVLPAVAAVPPHVQAPSSKPRSRSRRSTLESWFPLANFIDLKDDELQGWGGVVGIVNGL